MKDTTFTFRLPTTLKASLDAAAEADQRSLGQLVTLILKSWVDGGRYESAAVRAPRARAGRGAKRAAK